MRQPHFSGQFKRDVKLAQRRGKDMDKLKTLLGLLIEGNSLPAHQWSISQIARWLSGEEPAPASSGEVGTAGGVGRRRRGRPRAEDRGGRQ